VRHLTPRDVYVCCCREDATTLCGCLHTRPLACLPQEKGACLGTVSKGTPEWSAIANEAARTVPGRENGGNCDIKNLSRGKSKPRLSVLSR